MMKVCCLLEAIVNLAEDATFFFFFETRLEGSKTVSTHTERHQEAIA